MRETSRYNFQKLVVACLFSWVTASAICASANPAVTASTVNRDNKSDRLAITQRAAHKSAPSKNVVSSKHTPVGCESAFSPFANPGHADVLNYCAT
jgi:primosomal protein N'